MIKAGIVEGTGYKAGELIRLLLNHPDVELMWVSAEGREGVPVSRLHRGLTGDTDLRTTDRGDLSVVNVVFLCHPDGNTASWLAENAPGDDVCVIDLSADYRIADKEEDNLGLVYGIPEYNRKPLVRGAKRAVCPGELAMALELSLLPLAKHLMLNSDIHTTAVIGSSGAGESLNEDVHTMRADNVSPSALLAHDDIAEVACLLGELQTSFKSDIHVVGLNGPFSRGLIAVTYLDCAVGIEELRRIYEEYYDDHNFTFISDVRPDLKDVVNTNKCMLHLQKVGDELVIVAVIDNLLKGSAGNAVHVMNLLFGLQEQTGLKLKASAL